MSRAILLACFSALSACASGPAALTGETGIPFIRSNGVLEWKAASDSLVYIRGFDGKWYQARTIGPCARLMSATALTFEINGPDELDRHGAIVAEGWRCPLASVRRSEAPPGQGR